MKTGVAGVLILVGLAMLVGSNYVGGISEDQEWSEEKVEEFSELTAAVHVPTRNPEENRAKVDRLKEMQQEVIDVAEGAKSKKRLVKFSGLGATILGICFQIWAWTDKKKA